MRIAASGICVTADDPGKAELDEIAKRWRATPVRDTRSIARERRTARRVGNELERIVLRLEPPGSRP
jgi:hypothetical protein